MDRLDPGVGRHVGPSRRGGDGSEATERVTHHCDLAAQEVVVERIRFGLAALDSWRGKRGDIGSGKVLDQRIRRRFRGDRRTACVEDAMTEVAG